MENNKAMGHVIPFERSAEYLRRLAARKVSAGKPLAALELLRLSQRKAGGDAPTQFDIALIYAQIHCPQLSNRALFPLFDDEELGPESLYRAGCNFYAMRMEKSARDCLVLYLQKQPDGRFAPDAVDMIEAVDGDERMISAQDFRINRRTNRALSALTDGRPLLAARLIRRVLALEKKNSGAYALLSFALLACDKKEEGLAAARRALRLSGEDIRALCAMAASLKAVGSAEAAKAFLRRAVLSVENEEDGEFVCRTACDMGAHALARDVLRKMEGAMPLSDELLHLLAAVSYNTGNKDEALRCWRLLRRIDPKDMIAEHRLKSAEAGTLELPLSYQREIPQKEVLERLTRLRTLVQEGVGGLNEQWRENELLERLIRWGLCAPQPGIAEAMMGLLTTIQAEGATAPLLDLLPDATIPDDRKRNALAALCLMGAGGPHYAVIGERITLVHVSRAEKGKNDGQAEMLAQHVRRRLGRLTRNEEAMLLPLCRAACAQERGMSAMFRLRGVEMALLYASGKYSHTGAYTEQHRRLMRFARRIIKEVERCDPS